MMHFLQSHMSMLHYPAPVSSYSYGVQMDSSPSVTVSSSWQPHVPLNISTGLHLHHDAISHPPRNVWGCSRMPTQTRSPLSSCLHMYCSDRDGAAAHRLQKQCGTFQASRTTPNSPYMTHPHARAGPSLLSPAFTSYPVICQAFSASIPTMSNSHPVCSLVNSNYSNSPLRVQTSSTQNQTNPQTPIHASITPSGLPQYHTTFSSLSPLRVHASVCKSHSQNLQGGVSGPRQGEPVGSSPMHNIQGVSYSLLGQVTDGRDCRASLYQERSDNLEYPDMSNSTLTVEVQAPLLDMEGIQTLQ